MSPESSLEPLATLRGRERHLNVNSRLLLKGQHTRLQVGQTEQKQDHYSHHLQQKVHFRIKRCTRRNIVNHTTNLIAKSHLEGWLQRGAWASCVKALTILRAHHLASYAGGGVVQSA
eukprot:4008186-Amphidinium_carterae.1